MANGKDVVVTGVSTGIGWGTAKVLVSKGFRVFGSVRKQADADRLQREFGNRFVPLLMDITDADAVHQAAQKVGSMIGDRNLVGLVNNAGIVVSGPLLYLRPSEYRRQLEANMISPLVVIQAFAPFLGTDKKRQGPAGRIVNISSTGTKVAIPLIGGYSSSKAGLEGMSDALRQELILFGIDVVIIEPGTVNTAMYDKGEKEDLSESSRPSIGRRCRTSRNTSLPKPVLTAYLPSVWAKQSMWHSPRQNRRHATRSFRNVSRTGLCRDFFPRGCSTPISQSR
jgi:NAD(P)-dependent dehydrogenase (short-subunit alcohol dehydrogenase family)